MTRPSLSALRFAPEHGYNRRKYKVPYCQADSQGNPVHMLRHVMNHFLFTLEVNFTFEAESNDNQSSNRSDNNSRDVCGCPPRVADIHVYRSFQCLELHTRAGYDILSDNFQCTGCATCEHKVEQ